MEISNRFFIFTISCGSRSSSHGEKFPRNEEYIKELKLIMVKGLDHFDVIINYMQISCWIKRV